DRRRQHRDERHSSECNAAFQCALQRQVDAREPRGVDPRGHRRPRRRGHDHHLRGRGHALALVPVAARWRRRSADRGDRGPDRQAPGALDRRRHLGRAVRGAILSGGRVRPPRPDHAQGRRACRPGRPCGSHRALRRLPQALSRRRLVTPLADLSASIAGWSAIVAGRSDAAQQFRTDRAGIVVAALWLLVGMLLSVAVQSAMYGLPHVVSVLFSLIGEAVTLGLLWLALVQLFRFLRIGSPPLALFVPILYLLAYVFVISAVL